MRETMRFFQVALSQGLTCPSSKSILFKLALMGSLCIPSFAYAQEINVGVIAGLTRLGSTYGKGIVQGAEMATRDINAAGGINGQTIKLTFVDDASDPARSAIAMRRLVNANVDLIVGGWGSSQVLANMDIAEQAGIPYIVVGATNPRITTAKNRWTFRVIQTDSVMAKQLAEIAVGAAGLKRIAVISDTNAYGRGNRDVFIEALTLLGVKPIEVQSYRTSDTDFREQLNRIRAAMPDGLAIFGTIPAAPKIMKQAREIGIKARFLGTGGLANDALISLAPKASQRTVLMSFFDERSDAEAQAWSERYKREFADNEEFPRPVLAVWEYRAIRYIVAPCLERAGKDRTGLRDCIANWRGHLFGLKGEVYFDQSGQLVQPPVVVEVQNGTFRPFEVR